MKKISLITLLVSLSSACGLFISTDQINYPIYMGNAISLIELDSDYEELALYVYVQAYDYYDSTKFVWLIPLPAKPEILNPDYSIFEGLSKISAPAYKNGGYGYSFDCSYYSGPTEGIYGKDYYEVLQYPLKEPNLSDTMYAETIDTIINWLANQGISLPSQSQHLVQTYIDKSWNYFYAAIFTQVYEAKVGVKFRFASSNEVLPIYIARNNQFIYQHNGYYYEDYYDDAETSIYIYTIADSKKTYPLGTLIYANSISQTELDNIYEDFPEFEPELTIDDYLTKLEICYKEPNQSIDDDIILQNAADNNEYRELYEPYDYWYFTMDPAFILLVVLFLKLKIRRRKKKI